jgi:ribosome recycling factor
MPINQLATLSVADASMIVAQPYDPSQIAAIERAIMKSDLGLNPSSDGKVIRIPVPSLTEDRRKEIVKKAHDLAEHGRNSIRLVRREGNDKLKKMEKDKEVSQDDERRGLDEIQKLHDHYIAEVNTALHKKEQQIMEV